MKKLTILITGIGAPGAPGIIKSLRLVKERKIKIIGVDMRKDAVGSVLVDEFKSIPSANSSRYFSSLLNVAKKFKVEVILPLNTAELLTLSKNKSIFEKEGIRISISSPESIEIANNKYLLMEKLKNTIPLPRFYYVKSSSQFKKAVNKLGYPEKIVCFKPPISHGMRGFRILDSRLDRLGVLLNQKPTGIFTTFEEIFFVLKKSNPFPELLVMEFLPGVEYSVDALAQNGKSLIAIPRTRDYIKMGISFEGTLVANKEIVEYCKEISKKLNLNGNVGFQFKENEEGVPKLIECNPRLQGTVVINTFAGVNLVYLAVKLALDEKFEIPKKIKWGTKMIRYWEEVYKYSNDKKVGKI